MYRSYASFIDPTLALVKSIDPSDVTMMTATIASVDTQLASLPDAETAVEGSTSVDLAYLRIGGSICEVDHLIECAKSNGAPTPLVQVLVRIRAKAMKAYELATRHRDGSNGIDVMNGHKDSAPQTPTTTPQAWTREPRTDLGPELDLSDLM